MSIFAARVKRDMIEFLKRYYADIWTADNVNQYFELGERRGGIVYAKRLSDGTEGSLQYYNDPELYFDFQY